MRRALFLATALLAAATADSAAAQAAGAPRHLSWTGRSAPGAAVEAATPASVSAGRPRRPNPVIPHGGAAAVAAPPSRLTAAPGARGGLTPANAWLRSPAPPPHEAPPPPPVDAAPVRPQPQPQPQPRTTPEYLPDRGGRGQAVPADVVMAPPEPVQPSAADPMAPRRDAPIFRLQRDAPAPQPPSRSEAPEPAAEPTGEEDAPAEAPARRVAEVTRTDERPASWTGARYYSVHRQNGRQPDALAIPEPTYVDALAVTMTEPLASQDLAEPEQGPNLVRDAQGRLRAAPAPSDGDHQ